jgi:hypothetical protein
MRSKQIVPMALSLMTMLAAAPLEAQDASSATYQWWNVCGGTSFNTCASVDIRLMGTGQMRLRVWNRSGSVGVDGVPTPTSTVFTGIGFYNIGQVSAVATSLNMTGQVHLNSTGAAPNEWMLSNDERINRNGSVNESGNLQIGGGVKLEMAAQTENGVDDGIIRDCAPASQFPGGTNNFWANPCGDVPDWASDDGWVIFDFNFTGTWGSLATTEINLKGQNGPNGWSTHCITGGNQTNCYDVPVETPPPVIVTPEPMSILMLGTGLIAMGVLRRRRRRENT